jgi:ubiquinone/menaquinone biosynthesis C-methylase UbiE
VGRAFAQSIGYPADLLRDLPDDCVESFAGVSNISLTADIPLGATVLDLGCGAGLDALIASRRVGTGGRVVGTDFSPQMLGRARHAAPGARNLVFCLADAERLPLADSSIDVAQVNGIFNLNPARASIFQELARVIRKGGTVWSAELILTAPMPPADQSPANWFA